MAKIGLFYGTQTGNTQTEAEMIQQEFGGGQKKKHKGNGHSGKHGGGNQDLIERALYWLAITSYIWLAVGVIVSFFT